ncbi:hypothetical protein [Nocardia nepalensis]
MQVAVQPDQGAGPVVVQAQSVFETGDDGAPVVGEGEAGGA